MSNSGDTRRWPWSATWPLFVLTMLPHILPALRRDYPDLKLFLREETTGTACEGLHNGRTDCVLLALPYACGEVTAARLFDDRLFVAFPDSELPNPPAMLFVVAAMCPISAWLAQKLHKACD